MNAQRFEEFLVHFSDETKATREHRRKKSATPHEQLRDVYKIFYTLHGAGVRQGKEKLKIYGIARGNFHGVEREREERKKNVFCAFRFTRSERGLQAGTRGTAVRLAGATMERIVE